MIKVENNIITIEVPVNENSTALDTVATLHESLILLAAEASLSPDFIAKDLNHASYTVLQFAKSLMPSEAFLLINKKAA